jgi:integrase
MPNRLPAKAEARAIVSLANIIERARAYGEAAKAANTRRAYASDWDHFAAWCRQHGLPQMPATPGAVAAYLTAHAESLKVSTLGRRLAAIRAAHSSAGKTLDLSGQAFRDVWAGIRRERGTRPIKKRALVTADLRSVIAVLPNNLLGKRDRALLLIAFASAMRRSELASLVIGDSPGHRVRFADNGLLIELGRSKSDQEGAGSIIGVPFGSRVLTCPVRALRAWLEASGITSGPVFRRVSRHGHIGSAAITGHGIALAVKQAVYRAALADGHDEATAKAMAATIGGHSLRAGFVTAADAAGAPISKIMEQARHARFETTRGYIREADAFRDNAASYLGL